MASISDITSSSQIQMDYMNLLIVQLQNQNPLEPLDNNQMATQLAQLSQLQQLESMNKNLQALNEAYAAQLQGTNEHMKGADQVYRGIEDMMKNLRASVEETEKYKQQMSELSKNLADLNTIYGNMLTAMNVK